jgi:hypothetical protein
MSERTSVEDRHDQASPDETYVLQQRWHGWGSPVGLGVGLLGAGGCFVLFARGLAILDSIG